jgi:hypothetical protein
MSKHSKYLYWYNSLNDFYYSLKVQVEDKESAGCSFRVDVAPQVTIKQLKQMVVITYPVFYI